MPGMCLTKKICLGSYAHLSDHVAARRHGGHQGVEGLVEEHRLVVIHVHHRHVDQHMGHVCCALNVLRLNHKRMNSSKTKANTSRCNRGLRANA